MIGARLRLARSVAGLSLRGLEEEIDRRVTAQAIGKYERDESMPSPGVLSSLAAALGVSVEYLCQEETLFVEAVDFRRKSTVGNRELARIKAVTSELLERYLAVEDLLRLQSHWENPCEGHLTVREIADVEQVAEAVRGDWGLGVAPIRNLVELLEDRGLRVLSVGFGEGKIDGVAATAWRFGGERVSVIVVNANGQDGERRRFTLAHELGHLVLDVRPGVNPEKAAHRFAGAFLVPAGALRRRLGEHRTAVTWEELLTLKRLFGVSLQALTYRCKDLGIFGARLFGQLYREFGRRGWRSPPYAEPFVSRPEEPTRLRRLCLRAHAEGQLPASKAAELLGTEERQLFRQQLDQPFGDSPELE